MSRPSLSYTALVYVCAESWVEYDRHHTFRKVNRGEKGRKVALPVTFSPVNEIRKPRLYSDYFRVARHFSFRLFGPKTAGKNKNKKKYKNSRLLPA